MDDIKVSVIMPVYNAEKYLEKSLLFLCRQTLQNIEFIIINDASTDNSLDIMTAFKMAFPDKFVVLNSTQNRGPGGARNIGLSYARGEYVGFVDSDDFANPHMFELLYNKAKEKDSDLVMCAFRHKGVDDDLFIGTEDFKEGLNGEARSKLIVFTGFLWNSIFRKSIIDGMNIKFREKLTFQDIDFLIDFYCRIKNVDFVNKSLYLYSDNRKSVLHTSGIKEKYYEIIGNCAAAVMSRSKGMSIMMK